jgi:membrane protein DedA with SNARE-associated domain
MEVMVQDFLTNIGGLSHWLIYLFFFLSAVLQITIPPYPGDTILVFGGYMGSTHMFGGIIPIFLSYWLGTVVTSFVLYELGKWKGEEVLKIRLVSRFFNRKSQDKAKYWVLKYGLITFFISKFIPGVNSLIIMFGGVFRYNKLWAYIGIGLASLLHNVVFYTTGKTIGNNWDGIAKFLSMYNKVVIIITAAGLAAYLGYWALRKYRAKSSQF